jgi:GTP:adenosylcobinamide-phosphate guanylyltransferase
MVGKLNENKDSLRGFMKGYNIIVLAGDRGEDDPLAGVLGVPRKALLKIHDKPMLGYVLEAIRGSKKAKDIYVVANSVYEIEAGMNLTLFGDMKFLEGKSSPALSLKAILEKNDLFPVVILTADCPLLTSEIIDEFIEKAEQNNPEIAIGFATKKNIETLYPRGRRTYLFFKNEGYSGCNLFTFKSSKALKSIKFWAKFEKSRKKEFKLLMAFGLWNLTLMFLKRLDIFEAFERVSLKLGIEVKPVIISDANAAIDVDRSKHIAIVEKILKNK